MRVRVRVRVRVSLCVCVYCAQLNNNTRNMHAKYALWALFAYGGSFLCRVNWVVHGRSLIELF